MYGWCDFHMQFTEATSQDLYIKAFAPRRGEPLIGLLTVCFRSCVNVTALRSLC